MHLFGLRGYGVGTYAILVGVGLSVILLLKLLRDEAVVDVPGWGEQLMLWWSIAAVNMVFSRWLDSLDGGKVVEIDPTDRKRLVLVRPERHAALWIPVRHWTLIFILIGAYGALSMWSARP